MNPKDKTKPCKYCESKENTHFRKSWTVGHSDDSKGLIHGGRAGRFVCEQWYCSKCQRHFRIHTKEESKE